MDLSPSPSLRGQYSQHWGGGGGGVEGGHY